MLMTELNLMKENVILRDLATELVAALEDEVRYTGEDKAAEASLEALRKAKDVLNDYTEGE